LNDRVAIERLVPDQRSYATRTRALDFADDSDLS
jgi:hypothetical protein